MHTINFSVTYKKPEVILKKGDLYTITSNDNELSQFPVTNSYESFLLSLNSSLYEKEVLSQFINYKISQLYTYNNLIISYQKDDLTQSISLYYGNFRLSNDLSYSYDLNKIIQSATTVNYKYDKSFFQVYHKHKKDKVTLNNQEDLVYTIGFEFDKGYRLSYKEELDLSNDIIKRKEYRFGIDQKCWAFNLQYTDSFIASAKIDDSITRQDVIYLEFNFKELYKIDHQYKSN